MRKEKGGKRGKKMGKRQEEREKESGELEERTEERTEARTEEGTEETGEGIEVREEGLELLRKLAKRGVRKKQSVIQQPREPGFVLHSLRAKNMPL